MATRKIIDIEQNGVVYRCTRDSGTALSHALRDLVGLYVERVE